MLGFLGVEARPLCNSGLIACLSRAGAPPATQWMVSARLRGSLNLSLPPAAPPPAQNCRSARRQVAFEKKTLERASAPLAARATPPLAEGHGDDGAHAPARHTAHGL